MAAGSQQKSAMRWLYFDVSEEECSVIVHGDARYFLLSVPGSRKAYVSDACPHRGGPLHMGSPDADCSRIRCPWHRYSWSTKSLEARVAPAVRRGNRWSVVLSEAGGVPYRLNRRVVLQQRREAAALPNEDGLLPPKLRAAANVFNVAKEEH